MKSKILSVLSPLACFLVVSCANNIVPEPEITPEMTVSEDSFIFGGEEGEGGDTEFVVKTNSSWKASCDVSWITISPSSGDAGTTNVKVSVSALDEAGSRTGKITVTCGTIVRTIEVTQSVTPEMTVSEDSFIFGGEEGEAEFVVKSNSSWEASCDVSWITLSPSSGVAGTTNVKVSVNASDESEPRTGKITVTCDNIVKTIEVSQSEPETGNKLTFEFYGKLLISFPDIYGSKLLEAIIDWGDGSIEEHYYRGIEHIYDELGYYTITVKVANNTGLYIYNTNGFQSIDLSKF